MPRVRKTLLSHRAQQRAFAQMGDHCQAMREHILAIARAGRFQAWQVWSDFVEICATTISNRVDPRRFDERERRYLEVVRRYEPHEVERLTQAFAHLVMELEARPGDPLGECFMALELGSHWKGQFFTPYPVARMMAQMTFADGWREALASKGFVTLLEPTAGAGAMVIANAEVFEEHGLNPARHLHVTAVDVCPTASKMAYVQLSLRGIPAVVVEGNSLTMENRDVWYTPAHVLFGWGPRLRAAQAAGRDASAPTAEAAPAPVSPPAAMAGGRSLATSHIPQDRVVVPDDLRARLGTQPV